MAGPEVFENGRVKAWVSGVPFEDEAKAQTFRAAALPFIHKHIAVMPDVHGGIGATVGTVMATKGAIVPAAVGVDIGCGMAAVRTALVASNLPENLHGIRTAIEKAVPHGRTDSGGPNDRGAWGTVPDFVRTAWDGLEEDYRRVTAEHARASHRRPLHQLGTLGTGNHFIELWPACVCVKKLVEMKIEAQLDGVTFSGLWQCEVPYFWDSDMAEFHKNESSWCANNFLREENKGSVVWEGGEDRWLALKAEHDKDGACLCEALLFAFVRVVDSRPRRDLTRSEEGKEKATAP